MKKLVKIVCHNEKTIFGKLVTEFCFDILFLMSWVKKLSYKGKESNEVPSSTCTGNGIGFKRISLKTCS